jgi:hypothetical protein
MPRDRASEPGEIARVARGSGDAFGWGRGLQPAVRGDWDARIAASG